MPRRASEGSTLSPDAQRRGRDLGSLETKLLHLDPGEAPKALYLKQLAR
jgi:hypothetical protein